MTATDAATEVVADIAEEVSEQALGVAVASRGVSGRDMGIAVGAFFLGAGVGGGLVYVLAKRALEMKYSKISDDATEEMREHYNAKARALEAEAAKRPVEEIVKERGYSSPDTSSDKPPMAVPPPDSVREDEEDEDDEIETHNVFEDHGDEVVVEYEWDYQKELRKRSPDVPYVIHYDERNEMEYQVVTLTYYDGDDVLCNSRDEIVDPDDRDNVVGENNLNRFGHGSNDPVVVYIRNDVMELVYEVVKSPNKFSEEVHGFQHDGYGNRNLERMRARERDDPEE